MKLLKTISVLSLITLNNVIQASYLGFDDGEVVATNSTCLKVDKSGRLVSKPCSEATDFTLENKKFCSKSAPTNCLSAATKHDLETFFSVSSSKHLVVNEFDEDCGCLHIDYYGAVKEFKYSIKGKMFEYNTDDQLSIAPNMGIWKKDDMCWTTKVKDTGSPHNKIYLQKCRAESKNDKQAKKTQSWNFVNGQIKTGDRVMCVNVKNGKSVGAARCVEEYTLFTLLPDGQIAIKDRPAKCLIQKINVKKLGLGRCAQKLELVENIAPYQYTVIKNYSTTFSQEGNVAKIRNAGSYTWNPKFGNILLIKENWNYYTLKVNHAHKYVNYGVGSRNSAQFTVWGGDLGYTKKQSIANFSGGGYQKMYNSLGASRVISDTTANYLTGSLLKVIKTDTHLEFRCSSCGDTLIHKYTFVTGDYKDLYPALDVYYNNDSYDMVIY